MANEISWEEASGMQAPAVAPGRAQGGGREVLWEDATVAAPAQPGLWDRMKTSMAAGNEVLQRSSTPAMWGGEARGQARKPELRSTEGLNQIGQEVKALSNMIVGIPGGAGGVLMDIGSRISSLAIGEDAKAAGLRARATSENVNALWGKVTGALGLHQDATGSKIDELMGKGMEWSDEQGASAEQATGGVVSKETVQSVRDTLLNALGVKGLGMAGVAKGRAPKPGQGTGDALSADAAITASKARIAAAEAGKPPPNETAAQKSTRLRAEVERVRTESVAAATATPEVVTRVYENAIKNRPEFEDFWAGRKSKAPVDQGSSPAWDGMVKGLVKQDPLPPPQGPGLTPKTKLAEPTVLSQAPDLVESGLANLREGKLISTAEAKAICALKPLPDQGVIVGPNGKPYFQRGAVDPSLLKVLGLMGVGAVAGTALYNWWQSSGGLSEDNARDVGLGLAGLGGAGVVKFTKGGFWHPETVTRLADAVAGGRRYDAAAERNVVRTPEEQVLYEKNVTALDPLRAWAGRSVANYVNKHAGMATDPIKDLKLPDGTKWEDLTDLTIHQTLAEKFAKPVEGTRSGETVWSIEQASPWGNIRPASQAAEKVQNYLAHVGDYLRSRNITPAQLQQMDLPRAIRETVENDRRIAAEAIKDFIRPNPARMAETQAMPEYKSYPPVEQERRTFSFNKDKSIRDLEVVVLPAEVIQYSWREIKLLDRLTSEQARTVIDQAKTPEDVEALGSNRYVAVDFKGKVLEDRFSETPAVGATPEEAYLAGQLAKEGNILGHCVGGYCSQVLAGESRIISLRDQNGRSYATVELNKLDPADRYQGSSIGPAESIAQIKGPGNGAPPKYVEPYVQDFVKSGKWGDVQDLKHAGLQEFKGQYLTKRERLDARIADLEQRVHRPGPQGVDAESGGLPIADVLQRLKSERAQLGRADPKLLAAIATTAGIGAYLYNNPPKDKFTTLAAGLMGATVLRKSPTKYDAMLTAKNTTGLMEAMRAGGKEAEGAARAIHDATRSRLERSLWSFKDKIDTEDVLQETYRKGFEAMAEGKFEGNAQPYTYLHAIAQREALNAARNRKTTPEYTAKSSLEGPDGELTDISETLTSEGMRSPEQTLQNQQMVAKMQAALDKLSDEHRAVFELAEVEGLPYEEIATQLDIPLNTVRSRLKRARENLQESLKMYKPERQSGKVDANALIAGGLVTGGAAIGYLSNPENSLRNGVYGALAGGILGTGAGRAALKSAIESPSNALGVISTELANIRPALRFKLVEHESRVLKKTEQINDQVLPFLTALKKLPKEEAQRVDNALRNGDLQELATTPAVRQAYGGVSKVLGELGAELKSLGRFGEGVSEYFPRIVKDIKGLKAAIDSEHVAGLDLVLKKANDKMIRKEGRPLTDVEESIVINRYLFAPDQTSFQPGYAKGRKLARIPDKLQQFYEPSSTSLLRYISGAVADIERARFFGRDLQTKGKDGKVFTDIDSSIGNLVQRLELDKEQAMNVRRLLKARFEQGDKAMDSRLAGVRNVTNAALLGNIASAATQIGDPLFAAYHHGLVPTLQATAEALIGKSKITPKQLGLINHVAEELSEMGLTGRMLHETMKWSGFKAIDMFGKQMHLNAALIKWKQRLATPKGVEAFRTKYGDAYGPEIDRVVADVRARKITPETELLAFFELSDAQPITKAELPAAYLNNPNGRILYQLKTYMVKQADIVRRDAYQEIAKGTSEGIMRGTKNLAALATMYAVANVPGDTIKDWLAGRPLDPLSTPALVENVLQTFGINRYTQNKLEKGQVAETVIGMATPPVKVLQDIAKLNKESVKYVPFAGRIAYDRYLGGNEKKEKQKETQERIDLRDARETRNPSLKAARLRKAERAKRNAERKARSGQ